MKLKECELEMKVKVLGKTIHGTDDHYPALQRGWGYVKSKQTVGGDDTVYLTESVGGPSESGGYSPNDLEPYIEGMRLEDCKVGMKVKALGQGEKTAYDWKQFLDKHPDQISNITEIETDRSPVRSLIIQLDNHWWFDPNQLEPYIEPEETKYRQLKDITPRAILGGLQDHCFMKEFTRFVTAFLVQYDEVVPFDEMVDEFQVEPGWEKWLIQHGFIEKVVEEPPKPIYGMGDTIEIQGTKYLLACLDVGLVVFVSLVDGNRWSQPKKVKSASHISHAELQKIIGNYEFSKVEGK